MRNASLYIALFTPFDQHEGLQVEIRTKAIEAQFREAICTKCGKGVYRLSSEQNERDDRWLDERHLQCTPILWDMICSACSHSTGFTVPGPVIRYKGRDFVLMSSVAAKLTFWQHLARRLAALVRTKPSSTP